jgi:hypothetical protein
VAIRIPPHDHARDLRRRRQVPGGQLKGDFLAHIGAFRGFHIGTFSVPVANQTALTLVSMEVLEIETTTMAIMLAGFTSAKTCAAE